jgi:uncharacterized protein YbjT (DUF2867 family)
MAVAFVAGATGYVGREVVRLLCEAGVRAVAHVRPDSPRLEEWRARFGQWGAEVDTTPWEPDAMEKTLAALAPGAVFCLIGTTRARARLADAQGRDAAAESYDAVDFGLTDLLVKAAAGTRTRFVYLSALGVSPQARTAYGKARYQAEQAVLRSGLPCIIARPAFISGPDRDERRTAERVGAVLFDGLLRPLRWLGAAGAEARYRSIDATRLARALVRLALQEDATSRTVEADELQRLGSG